MPSLYLLRHGKSDRIAAVPDHDRELRARGRRAARLVGTLLGAAGEAPELVLVSSAVRALRTAQLAVEAGGWTAELSVRPELYQASVADVLALLAGADPALERLLVVGHEPTTSSTIERLTGARVVVPTGAIARIDVTSFGRADDGNASLCWLLPPRLLAAFV